VWWYIPAIQEVEIGRIAVLGQPSLVHETPLHQKKVGMVVYTCHPSFGRKHK
jgi:hypothetical protein